MSRMERLKALIEQYGRLAIVLHFAVWIACVGLFTAVFHLGFGGDLPGALAEADVPGTAWLAEHLGAFGFALTAGYAVTQVLKLPRIALTLALTPILARRFGHVAPQATDVSPRG
jgi:uncharacterized membrane protein